MRTRMMKTAFPLAMALALGLLAAAVPASAQDWRRPRGGYDDRSGYGDRDYRDNRGGYDRYGDRGDMQQLSRQLAREADRLRREAWQVNRREVAPPVREMLASLDRLAAAAARFERQTTRGYGSRYGGSELDELFAAHDAMRYALSGINPARYMREGAARIDDLMDGLYRSTDRTSRRDGDRRGRGGRYGDRGYDDGYDGYPRRRQ